MNRCYCSKENNNARIFNLVLGIPCAFALVAAGFVLWDASDAQMMVLCIGAVMIGIMAIVNFVLFDILYFREYDVSEYGITIRYFGRKEVLHRWDKVTQICRCIIHRSGTGATQDDVIWITFGQIKNGPPHEKYRWRTISYGLRHFRTVLTLEYTPERLNEIKNYTTLDISDYRHIH